MAVIVFAVNVARIGATTGRSGSVGILGTEARVAPKWIVRLGDRTGIVRGCHGTNVNYQR